jgi:hypothetical protein
MSQLSTDQSSSKKMKHMTTTTTTGMIHSMATVNHTHTHQRSIFQFIRYNYLFYIIF